MSCVFPQFSPQPRLLMRVRGKLFLIFFSSRVRRVYCPVLLGEHSRKGWKSSREGHDHVPWNLPESPGENPKGKRSARAVYESQKKTTSQTGYPFGRCCWRQLGLNRHEWTPPYTDDPGKQLPRDNACHPEFVYPDRAMPPLCTPESRGSGEPTTEGERHIWTPAWLITAAPAIT